MHLCEASLVHHLPFRDRLVVNRREAASMVGVSPSYFDKLVRRGLIPQPLPFPGVKRWNKVDIQRALDAAPGVDSHSHSADNATEEERLDRELAAFEAKHAYEN